jgi:hypothetical protein
MCVGRRVIRVDVIAVCCGCSFGALHAKGLRGAASTRTTSSCEWEVWVCGGCKVGEGVCTFEGGGCRVRFAVCFGPFCNILADKGQGLQQHMTPDVC